MTMINQQSTEKLTFATQLRNSNNNNMMASMLLTSKNQISVSFTWKSEGLKAQGFPEELECIGTTLKSLYSSFIFFVCDYPSSKMPSSNILTFVRLHAGLIRCHFQPEGIKRMSLSFDACKIIRQVSAMEL